MALRSARTLGSRALLCAVVLNVTAFSSRYLLADTVPEPTAQVIKSAIPTLAQPLPLADVRLTGGPLKNAEDLDAKYLLSLQPDRMLYYLEQRAGMTPKATGGYGGWDGAGRQLTGHIAGHYLSAVSYMYAATGDPRFKERVDYLVNALADIQEHNGDGYIGGLLGNAPRARNGGPPGGAGAAGGGGGAARGARAGETTTAASQPAPAAAPGGGARRGAGNQPPLIDGKTLFEQLSQGTIRSGGFDLNGMWSPWYVEHKIFAGLRDAYRLTGNKKALEVEIKFGNWVGTILGDLNDQQIQQMLATEFGGMNEVLADLYADTGDKKFLTLSDKFEHKAIVDPLAEKHDILNNKHGNTQVPKLLGELMRYVYTGDETDGNAAKFFWDEVALHHSFATGGHGRNEYFGQPDKLNSMIEGRTAESCNVYNMLKMTRELFSIEPDIKYADFHERAIFNHILASINPETGATSYMVPVGQGVIQEYQGMNNSFTCCVGTGMESHALHAYGIYYSNADKLWVNLFAPSIAQWKAQGTTVEMVTSFPAGDDATLKITPDSPKELIFAIRRPYWAGDGFSVKVNGEALTDLPKPDSYVEIKRTWKAGDTIALVLPKTLWKAPLADNPDKAALMWGPLVLAADMSDMARAPGENGRRGGGNAAPTYPIFVNDAPVSDWLKAGKNPGEFVAAGRSPANGSTANVTFIPFYQMYDTRYGIYWDVMTNADWEKRGNQVTAEQAAHQKLLAATVGFAQPGQMQPERDFNYQAGEEVQPVSVDDHPGRRAITWFSFDLPVEDTHPMTLVVTYRNDEPMQRHFTILADGKNIATVSANRASPQEVVKFYDVEYEIPADVVKGKKKVTVRFQADDQSEVARVFGLRTVRSDAAK